MPLLQETVQTHTLDFQAWLEFESNIFCDDVKKAQMLDGCRMKIDGELKLRERKCHHSEVAVEAGDHRLSIGCQMGRFLMYRPVDPNDFSAGFVPVFEGELTGTVGFDPGQEDRSRCCVENFTRGMMVGQGLGMMRDCTICVTYDGWVNSFDETNLCADQSFGWKMKLDGTVCCPCPPHEDEEPR